MTFGAYHQFNTNKMMELNNGIIKSEYKREMDKMGLNNEIIKSEHTENIGNIPDATGTI